MIRNKETLDFYLFFYVKLKANLNMLNIKFGVLLPFGTLWIVSYSTDMWTVATYKTKLILLFIM